MIIRETTAREMGDVYGQLFIEIFGSWTEHHVPDKVWLFLNDTEDDIIGFASGFQTKSNEIFLMWGGERKQYRGHSSKKRLREIRDYLHDRYKFIITEVENTNLNMLRLYLSIGYLIYEIKYSTDRHTYLQLISTQGEE